MNVFGLFEFYTPEALWLLLLLPVWWIWRRRRRKDAIVFSRTSVLAAGPATGSWIPKTIFLLRNVALALLVIALARPRSGAHIEKQTSEGINIVLAKTFPVQCSRSTFVPPIGSRSPRRR